MDGYICLHRKILDSSVFQDETLLKIWIWCLCKASYKDRDIIVGNTPVKIRQGQFVYGKKKAAAELKIPETTVYRKMKLLQELSMIVLKVDRKWTVVTVENWAFYQNDEPRVNRERTNCGLIAERSRTNCGLIADTNNKVYKDNNVNKDKKVNKVKNISTVSKDTVCSEPAQSSNTKYETEYINDYSLPLNDGTFYTPTDEKITEWMNVFPGVKTLQEFRKMRLWLNDNPTKRKTRRGINRFISSWLGRCQDKPQQSSAIATYKKPNNTDNTINLLKEFMEDGNNE